MADEETEAEVGYMVCEVHSGGFPLTLCRPLEGAGEAASFKALPPAQWNALWGGPRLPCPPSQGLSVLMWPVSSE